MNQPREEIRKALFALLKGAFTWKLAEPQARTATQVGTANQPYMTLLHGSEDAMPKGVGLTKWSMHYECWVYLIADQARTDEAPADTAVNTILNAIENAFMPNQGEAQQLGGLVVDCRLDGKIIIVGGVMNTQMTLIIPITVLNAMV